MSSAKSPKNDRRRASLKTLARWLGEVKKLYKAFQELPNSPIEVSLLRFITVVPTHFILDKEDTASNFFAPLAKERHKSWCPGCKDISHLKPGFDGERFTDFQKAKKFAQLSLPVHLVSTARKSGVHLSMVDVE